jgi:RNA polymerase sporulation-specific sigma factor
MKRNIYILRRMSLKRLIELSQIGDNQAMGLILEKFEPMVKSIISKYYGTWADFEDFTQIGFVGLIQAVYNFKEDSNTKFSTFAYLNISSEIKSFLTYLNRQKNKVLTEAVSMESNDDNFNENSDYYFENPEDNQDNNFLTYLIEDTIQDMKDEEQEILKLWFRGYSYNEVSEKLEVKNKKVDNTIQKVKKILVEKKEIYDKLNYFFGGNL